MAAKFTDILPYLAGAAAGLAGPQVGGALARGVGIWNMSKRNKQVAADRAEAKRRADKAEGRADIRFEQSQSDRVRGLSDAETSRTRANLRWDDWVQDQAHEAEQRQISAQDRVRSHRLQDEAAGRAAAAAGRAEQDQAYQEGQRARAQEAEDQAALAFADLANTEEGKEWLDIPSVREWARAQPSSLHVMEGFKDWQEDKASGGKAWQVFSRLQMMDRSEGAIRKEMEQILQRRDEIRREVMQERGLVSQNDEVEDSEFQINAGTQREIDSLSARYAALQESLDRNQAVQGAMQGTTGSQQPQAEVTEPADPDPLIARYTK